jgi:hypothetical protein
MSDLPFDILDHIFGLLKSDPKSLIACSKAHPLFIPIAERYRYYHVIVHTGSTDFPYSFKPIRLMKLISATPRIVNHVRIFQIEFNPSQFKSYRRRLFKPFLGDIALLLPRFLHMECLMLSTKDYRELWTELPHSFRTAVEGCLYLPTLEEVHVGHLEQFPLSILDNHTNINLFSLSTTPKIPEYSETIYPQLKSLSVQEINPYCYKPFSTWANRHIGNLQSLEFNCTDCELTGLDLLKGCSDTLENLYIIFWSNICELHLVFGIRHRHAEYSRCHKV